MTDIERKFKECMTEIIEYCKGLEDKHGNGCRVCMKETPLISGICMAYFDGMPADFKNDIVANCDNN